ncbi:MAG: prolipoprotein diacylglyceryl transferase family protein [Cyanobacteria bacterium P01_F01_bin.116]
MQFPVYIGFGTWKIHPHFLFEFLGYVIAFRLLLRRNLRSDPLPLSQRTSIITGGMVGAVLGAKLLVLVQHIDLIWLDWRQWLLLIPQGKTIVGALLGGLIGVEVTKAWIGVTRSTGDVFVYPLLVGTAIGRIGCFLTGLSDRTYGITTSLPWGINFGDGILRHPTQLYEILFLLLLGIALAWRKQSPYRSGELFQLYLGSYLSFRFLIDFLKPDFHLFLGMSAVQCACLLGMLYTYRTRQSITPH